jgi:kynurenine formamidase
MIFIEEMNNLDQILDGNDTARALFVYPPIEIQGAEAGPCRPVAIVFED